MKYKGYILREVKSDLPYPIYGVYSPKGEEVGRTLLTSEFKELVDTHISMTDGTYLNEFKQQ